jgi:hypothetical protein
MLPWWWGGNIGNYFIIIKPRAKTLKTLTPDSLLKFHQIALN